MTCLTRVLAAGLPMMALSACAQPSGSGASEPDASGVSDWTLVWADEFESDAIDPARWDFDRNCWGGGNAERQCYTDRSENARVEDGHLIITAHLEETEGPALPIHMREPGAPVDMRTQPFSSARLVTRGRAAWRYGRIEVRAELPRGQGVWPAIWMLPEDPAYGGWAASGEIDIMEAVNLGTPCEECESGIEDQVLGTLHYGGEWPNNAYSGSHVTLDDQVTGFHTYAIEWSEAGITWFVDGEAFACQTPEDWYSAGADMDARPSAPFDQPFHLIMNVAIGGGLPERENLGGVSYEGFPKTMQVDFVRVYEWTGEGAMPAPEGPCEPEYRGDSSSTGG